MASKSNSFASLAEFGFWFLIFVHLMFCPHSANFVLGVFRSLFFQNGCQSGDYSKSFLVRIFLRWQPVCGNPNLVPSDFSVNGLQDSSRLSEISGTLQITWLLDLRQYGGQFVETPTLSLAVSRSMVFKIAAGLRKLPACLLQITWLLDSRQNGGQIKEWEDLGTRKQRKTMG